jgi:hypothetical protein
VDDYISGLNVHNVSTANSSINIKMQDGSGNTTRTLKPREIWNYGYAENKNMNWKLMGNYLISNDMDSITVYVNKDTIVVEWNGSSFVKK